MVETWNAFVHVRGRHSAASIPDQAKEVKQDVGSSVAAPHILFVAITRRIDAIWLIELKLRTIKCGTLNYPYCPYYPE